MAGRLMRGVVREVHRGRNKASVSTVMLQWSDGDGAARRLDRTGQGGDGDGGTPSGVRAETS